MQVKAGGLRWVLCFSVMGHTAEDVSPPANPHLLWQNLAQSKNRSLSPGKLGKTGREGRRRRESCLSATGLPIPSRKRQRRCPLSCFRLKSRVPSNQCRLPTGEAGIVVLWPSYELTRKSEIVVVDFFIIIIYTRNNRIKFHVLTA
jgi:hypothetical protein